jgi:D-alanyl-D-alanine carboxypeptidase
MRLLTLVPALLLLLSPVRAQQSPVDAAIEAELNRSLVPGLAVVVARDGKIEYSEGFGLASVELAAAVRPETVFQIASLTKQFTAAGILLLVQDGKLGLDDSVTKHVSGLPAEWKPVTIRHLLNHTSGIPSYTEMKEFLARLHEDVTPRQIIEMSFGKPLDFQPGGGWSYNNTGYILLGMVIEQVSGQGYDAFLQERIFQPLGMKSTMLNDPRRIVLGRAQGYVMAQKQLHNVPYLSMTWPGSAGALISSATDLARWDAALHTDTLLNPESKALMWTRTKLSDGKEHPYGFGWGMEVRDGKRVAYHGGGIPGFSAYIERNLDDKLSIIILANGQVNEGTLARNIRDALAGKPAVDPAKPVEDKRPELTKIIRTLLTDLQQGKIDRSHLTPEFSKLLTDQAVATTAEDLKMMGALARLELLRHAEVKEGVVREYRGVFAEGAVRILVNFNLEGKIAGMQLRLD